MKKAMMVVCCAALLLATGTAWGGSVQGRLLDRYYMPVKNARLLFFRIDDGEKTRRAEVIRRVGANGWFKVELAAGTYTMVVSRSGTDNISLADRKSRRQYRIGERQLLDLGSVVLADDS